MDKRMLVIPVACVIGCIASAKNDAFVSMPASTQPSTQPFSGAQVRQTQSNGVAVGTGLESNVAHQTININGGGTLLLLILGIAIIAAAAWVFKGRRTKDNAGQRGKADGPADQPGT